MTNEQSKISDVNREKAVKYFNLQKGYVLHHINPEWKHSDIDRYIQWNPEDLIVMTISEHVKLHWTYDHDERAKKISASTKGVLKSDETRRRMSEAQKGKVYSEATRKKLSENVLGEKNPNYGRDFSEEHRRKIGEAAKGRHYYNNGKICVREYECPDGFVAGRLL